MKHCFLIFLVTIQLTVQAQDHSPFEINYQKDVPLLLAGAGSFAAGNILLNQVNGLQLSEIQNLDPNDLNFLDRHAVDNFSATQSTVSDILVTVASVAPVATLLDREIRDDFLSILVMAAEVALINNGINMTTKALVLRPRPYIYNPRVGNEIKMEKDARYSFYSAHTSNAASLSFFTASIISAYSNDQTLKTMVWSGAIILPLATGYFRYSSGQHFPTDIITGYVIGASIGYLVPLMHRRSDQGFQSFTIESNGLGIRMRYVF